jgi:serine/threonine protein kinase
MQRTAEKTEEMKQHVPGTYARILSQEVRLLQVLDHPNIIKLYRMIETEQDYYIIMYANTWPCVLKNGFLLGGVHFINGE